jgi:hypothetical protein
MEKLVFFPPPHPDENELGRPEAVFVNVYRAQESIAPGWESIPGLLKRPTNTGFDILYKY